MEKNSFSPLSFLASLGAGGIAVVPFAFFQYTYHTGKGLITFNQIDHFSLPLLQQLLFYALEIVMVVFAIIHFVLTYQNTKELIGWVKTKEYEKLFNDPLKNAGIMATFLSYFMTMNVFIGPIRFFIPFMSKNLQATMLPALIVGGILWALMMRMEIKLLKTSFVKSFDVSKIHFGWLLHPFALAMGTVTLTGIAAMSKTPNIAHTAASLAFISGSMAFFLLIVKLISIFKSHFAAEGLPDKQFLPSMLIVVPIITLLAISGFRLGHYFERQLGFHTEFLEFAIIAFSFAFETWYLMFGLALLKDYFKKHFFKKEYYITQWGLICPFVAYAVLGSFLYELYIPSPFLYGLILVSFVTAIALFSLILSRHINCRLSKKTGTTTVSCYS
ncbi:hypothetical protein KJ966_05935 [bacterium]|nr:hypothetical protein [bacterium]